MTGARRGPARRAAAVPTAAIALLVVLTAALAKEIPFLSGRVVDEASLRLWRLLDETTPAHVDDLAERAQINVGEALRKLAELELKGMCLQRPGKYFLRR